MRQHASVLILSVAALATGARAETYTFEAGDEWSKIGPRLVAGDEVVLLEGTHIPAQFENLAGEPGRPIVIRPAEKVQFAEIAAKREGLRLTNCRHVRVERLHIKGARRAGIVVDSIGEARSHDVAILDSIVAGVSGLVEQSGVLVISTDGIDIRRTRIENCAGSMLRFENSSAITCERLQLRTTESATCTTAMLFLGEVDRVDVNDAIVTGRFETGLSLGAKDAPRAPREVRDLVPLKPRPAGSEAAPQQPSTADPNAPGPQGTATTPPKSGSPGRALFTNATFTNILLSGCERAIEVGSSSSVLVASSTIVDPVEEVIRLVPPPRADDRAKGGDQDEPLLRFRENIVVWQPRGLRRFIDAPDGVDAKGLFFGPNLWWSSELPDSLPLLGPAENPFVGTVETPQTTSIDPKLDPNGRTVAENAKLFGRNL